MTALQNLQASATALEASVDSAIAAVQAYVAANPNNDTALTAIQSGLDSKKAQLDAAVSSLTAPAA